MRQINEGMENVRKELEQVGEIQPKVIRVLNKA